MSIKNYSKPQYLDTAYTVADGYGDQLEKLEQATKALEQDKEQQQQELGRLESDKADIAYVDARDRQVLSDSRLYTDQQTDALRGDVPATLDTLEKIGDAVGNDPAFSASVQEKLDLKYDLSGGWIRGDVVISPRQDSADGGNTRIGRDTNGAYFNSSDAAGNITSQLRLWNDGKMTHYSRTDKTIHTVWTKGNFDPDTKYDSTGGELSGAVKIKPTTGESDGGELLVSRDGNGAFFNSIDSGSVTTAQLRLWNDGKVTVYSVDKPYFRELWDKGNFNPDEKLGTEGGTLTGELVCLKPNAMRFVVGDTGVIIRSDENYFYFMVTEKKDPYGDWNDLRPFSISKTTGYCFMDSGLSLRSDDATITPYFSVNNCMVGTASSPFAAMHAKTFHGDLKGNADTATRLVQRTIAPDTNLDSCTEAGMYHCSLNTTAATLVNCPTKSAFGLFVEKHAYTKQTVTEHIMSTPRMFFRNSGESGWGPWHEIYTSANPPSTK